MDPVELERRRIQQQIKNDEALAKSKQNNYFFSSPQIDRQLFDHRLAQQKQNHYNSDFRNHQISNDEKFAQQKQNHYMDLRNQQILNDEKFSREKEREYSLPNNQQYYQLRDKPVVEADPVAFYQSLQNLHDNVDIQQLINDHSFAAQQQSNYSHNLNFRRNSLGQNQQYHHQVSIHNLYCSCNHASVEHLFTVHDFHCRCQSSFRVMK